VSVEPQTRGYVLAVTGLKAEARVAERSPRTRAVAGGGQAGCLERQIEEAITKDCRGVISFGVAAGLKPELRPGTCLIGCEVVDENGRHLADDVWTTRLKARLGQAVLDGIASVDRPLVTPAQKQALLEATGAGGADMESHVAARVAAEHGVPFAVLRVVSDPAERAIPSAALVGMRDDGSTDAGALLRSLKREPGQIPLLLRVAADVGRAYYALLRCHRRLGAGLGLLDLG
jgi:hopanoid-associated phosphorylase